MNGAEIVVKCLAEQGVEAVFGYPGGTILNIYDALYENKYNIKHYLTSHEQGAVHAADGYARATGKVGVCMATSGPGATNLVTGLATAYMDSVPLVAVTCNVARNLLGKDSFQEVDITGITMPITKHNCIVKNAAEIPEVIRNAFVIACSGRKGPVLIDIPKDVTYETVDFDQLSGHFSDGFSGGCESVADSPRISEKIADKAARLIRSAKKPFILVGGGACASGAETEIKTLASLINCPVGATLMGLCGYDGRAEEFVGMAGMYGSKACNTAISSCDLLIAIGVRFSERVVRNENSFAKNAKIIHIDIDAAELNKNIRATLAIESDAKSALSAINAQVVQKTCRAFLDRIIKLKKPFLQPIKGKKLTPQYVIQTAQEKTRGDAIVVTEVGQNQMWTAQYYRFFSPASFITSGGLGTMGFGTGAAIGAKIGRPDKTVISFAGDGSFRMSCNELATAQFYGVKVIIIVLNNHALGMVRQMQNGQCGKRYSETTLDRMPDFKKLAQAYGVVGFTVNTRKEFDAALEAALNGQTASVIDVNIDIDEKVINR